MLKPRRVLSFVLLLALALTSGGWLKRGSSGGGATCSPAAAQSLGICDVVALSPSNTGYRSTPVKIPSAAALDAAYPGDEANWDATNFRVVLGGTYSGTRRTFSGWDLTSVKGYIEIQSAGWTISDNLVGPSASNGVSPFNINNFAIKTSNIAASHTPGDANSNVIIEYNTITGFDQASNTYWNAGAIASTADVSGVEVRYNYMLKSAADYIKPRGDDWYVHHNYATTGGFGTGAHFDFLQILSGNRLIARYNHADMTPHNVADPIVSEGRTNAFRLEAFFSGQTVNDARVEYNYVPGTDVLDSNGDPNFNVTHSTGGGGGGAGTVSGNQINFNAAGIRLSAPANAFVHPLSNGVTGTGNRNILNNAVISDFSFP